MIKLHGLIVAGLAALATPVGASAQASDAPVEEFSPRSIDLARQVVDLGFPAESREQLFFAAIDQISSQMRESILKTIDVPDEGALAVMDQWLSDYNDSSKEVLRSHIPSLMDGLVRSYATIFTEDELADILAFVSTPSGQRFFELSSAVMAEPNFAAANQAYMDEALSTLPAATQELQARLREYFRKKADMPAEEST